MADGQLYKMQMLPKKKIPIWVLILVGVIFLGLVAIFLRVIPGIA